MASFDDFLRTGRLGPIEAGLTKEAVRELLGDPEDTSVGKNPEIWKYGPLELAFYRDRKGLPPDLVSIAYQFHRGDDTPPASLRLSGRMPTGELSFEEFRAHLNQAGIPVIGGVETGPRRHLVLGSRARVTFEEDGGSLSSVHHSAGPSPEAEFKQISISITPVDFDSIRREAKARGLSASALCSLWIAEHATGLKGQRV